MSTNPYKRLIGLLPTNPLQVGQVVSSAGGKVVAELPGGGRITARGAGTVGANVFIRAGLVEGAAPSLNTVVIEVGT